MTVVAMALVIVVWKLPEEVGGGVVALETKAVGNEVSLEESELEELGNEIALHTEFIRTTASVHQTINSLAATCGQGPDSQMATNHDLLLGHRLGRVSPTADETCQRPHRDWPSPERDPSICMFC